MSPTARENEKKTFFLEAETENSAGSGRSVASLGLDVPSATGKEPKVCLDDDSHTPMLAGRTDLRQQGRAGRVSGSAGRMPWGFPETLLSKI